MSKAVLIIDMPKNCDECHLCMKYTVGDEWIAHCQVYCEDITDLHIRHDNCPLKPINEKALKSGDKDLIIYQRAYLMKNAEREAERIKEAAKYESI